MKTRRNRYKEESPIEYLLLRKKLGLSRYRKTMQRNPEKRCVLVKVNLRRIEKNDYLLLGKRGRRLSVRQG